MYSKINDAPVKQSHSVEGILSHLQSNLTLSERKSFLENLSKSASTLALLVQVEPQWKIYTLNLEIEIEKTKEFIRIYSIWSKGKLEAQTRSDHEVLCQKLDDFLADIKNTPKSNQPNTLRKEVSYIFGEDVIQCFEQKIDLLFQLESKLNDNKEKALLTLELSLTILHKLKPELFSDVSYEEQEKPFKYSNENGKHPVVFFSERNKPLKKKDMLEIDITEEEMLYSAFGQGSNTAKSFNK